MRFTQLSAWLQWLEALYPQAELSLDRVRLVASKMRLSKPAPYVITVAGTNGKGSCVALLEAILLTARQRVGVYTSPHLLRYNERIKINAVPVGEQSLCEAFAYIDEVRQATCLTYFEFSTLAALYLFAQQALDVVILEVGLGGRLDAVNLVDADLAIISGVDFDHEAYLGNTLEAIGFEKAGIMRPAKPAVYGGATIPHSILQQAERLELPLYCYGRDYQYQLTADKWHWQSRQQQLLDLPLPKLPVANAATVLQAYELLPKRLQTDLVSLKVCLASTNLAGRFQQIQLANQARLILDVAHNPQACGLLAQRLQTQACEGISYAIVAMMADKAILASLKPLQAIIQQWYITGLALPRAATVAVMAENLAKLDIASYYPCVNVAAAYQQIMAQAKPEDRIVVFGSFHTVSEMLRVLNTMSVLVC